MKRNLYLPILGRAVICTVLEYCIEHTAWSELSCLVEQFVVSGVPQGTVLVLLHLLNFINDFLEQLQSKVHIVSDLIVFKVINNMTDLEILQPDLQGLDNQEITCIIEIHPAKMQCDASGKQTLFDIIHAERVSVMGRDRLKILECKYLQWPELKIPNQRDHQVVKEHVRFPEAQPSKTLAYTARLILNSSTVPWCRIPTRRNPFTNW